MPLKNRPSSNSVPPIQRQRKARDLARAEWLRPRDIREIYGISQQLLWVLVNHANAAKRLPATRIPGRGQRMGLTLVKRSDIEAYLSKHSNRGQAV